MSKGRNDYLCFSTLCVSLCSASLLSDTQFSQKLRRIKSVVTTVSETSKTPNKSANISYFLKSKAFITVTSDPTIYDFLFFSLTDY